MLYVARQVGKEVLIGDHSVVTVVNVDRETHEVKLGFDTLDRVKRVDSPELLMEAAKVRARLSRRARKSSSKMEELPVYVAHTSDQGELGVKAGLTLGKAHFPGANVMEVTKSSNGGPRHHEFLVLRVLTERTGEALVKFCEDTMGWRHLDTLEHDDATVYMLVIRTVGDKQGDVRYVDLT